MDETIDRIIKQSGEMWEAVRDRKDSPVLIVTELGHNATVHMLSLEEGARHPYWIIRERELTEEELGEIRRAHLSHVGSLQPLASPNATHALVTAYVRNGRKPFDMGWTITLERVRVQIERVE